MIADQSMAEKLPRHPIRRRHGFALIELPLVLLIIALAGISIGSYVWYRSGHLTIGAWAGFALVLPLVAFLTLLFASDRRDKRHS